MFLTPARQHTKAHFGLEETKKVIKIKIKHTENLVDTSKAQVDRCFGNQNE